MRDDRPHRGGEWPDDELPASVIFTEMMRREVIRHHSPDGKDALPAAEAVAEAAESAARPATSPPSDAAGVPDEADLRRRAALEAQRIRRVERRRQDRRQRTMGAMGGTVMTIVVAALAAALTATILSWWTSPASLDPDLRASLSIANATSDIQALPTAIATPNWLRRIGVVSGHRGPENDPGAVCQGPNGEVLLTENEVNFAIAQRVVQGLRERGYNVDLLDEFDMRLEGYQAAALVSIHANDCSTYGGEYPSGFLIAQAETRSEGGDDTRLRECIAQYYGRASGLERRYGLTRDMTDYHIFREIHPRTPGVILETGFMLADQELLVNNPDRLAQSVIDGVICFLEGEAIQLTPVPDEAG